MRSRISRTIIILLCSFAGMMAHAQDQTPKTRKFQTLVNGASITVYDPDYDNWGVTGTTTNPPVCQVGTDYYRIYNIYDRVFMEVDKNYKFTSDFNFSVTFNICIYDKNNVLIQQCNNRVLTLNYRVNDPYTHKTQLQYENTKCTNRLVISIVSISNPSNIPLTHVIAGGSIYKQSLQYMPANPEDTKIEDIEAIYEAGTNSLDIKWHDEDWASSYDIQWLYVDDYTPYVDDVPRISDELMNTGTKLNIDKCHYSIPLMYDKGYLIYRVRGNGKVRGATINAENDIPGSWQYSFDEANLSTASYVYKIDAGHAQKLNWQSSITFSEQGKKLLQAAYFDGVSRERQKISLISQGGRHGLETGMLEETVYDEEGRPAAKILPAPTGLPHVNFFPGFNRSDIDNTKNFAATDFDRKDLSDDCINIASGLSTSSGASAYYSASNSFLSDPKLGRMYSLLPDAGKFPYALTVYTNDNTGRVREQTGVGSAFRLGQGHTNKYYYGKPLQQELDRLFGSDVGYAANYQKTMVKDANGQFSISYKDLSGRVIATSLAGTAPEHMELLSSSPDAPDASNQPKAPIMIEADLLNKSSQNAPGADDLLYLAEGKRVLSSNLVVSSEANRYFYYKLQHPTYQPNCTTSTNKTSAVIQSNFIASSAFHTPGSAIVDFKTADIDGDGDQDIVYSVSEKLIVLQNRMNGNQVDAASFYKTEITLTGISAPLIELRDLDRDKNPELIVYSKLGTSFRIYRNNSDKIEANFIMAKEVSATGGIRSLVAAEQDYPVNSRIWVIADESGSNKLYTYEIEPNMLSGLYNFTLTSPVLAGITAPAGNVNMYIADVSESHAAQEVIVAAANGSVSIYSNTLSLIGTATSSLGLLNLTFANVNADNFTDIIAYGTGTSIYYIPGAATLSSPSLTSLLSSSGAGYVAVGDYNSDLAADLIFTIPGNLLFAENNATSVSYTVQTPSPSLPVSRVYTCDLNADGKPDFISVGNNLVWYQNVTNNNTSCYECVLDVTVSLQSKECGKEYLPDLTTKTVGETVTDYNYITVGPNPDGLRYGLDNSLLKSCGTPQEFTRGGTAPYTWAANKGNPMKVGEYQLYRTISINEKALDIYANNYIKHSNCLKTYKDFETAALSEMRFDDCDLSCEERERRLAASYEESEYHDNQGCENKFGCLLEEEYNQLKSAWNKECGDDYNGCEGYLEIMMNDMSPEGQYGKVREKSPNINTNKPLPDPEPGDVINPSIFPLSVFNEGNQLPQKLAPDPNPNNLPARTTPNWRYPVNEGYSGEKQTSYLDETGEIAYITVAKNGNGIFEPYLLPQFVSAVLYDENTGTYKAKPNHLYNVTDFISQWQSEWAASLIIYHPEYGYYKECMNRVESNKRDAKMMRAQRATTASAYFPGWSTKPAGTYPANAGSMRTAVGLFVAEDPYFTGNEKDAEKNAFIERLLAYNESADGRSIWDLTYLLVNGDPECTTSYYQALLTTPQKEDEEWQMFRSLYISLKQEVLKRHDTRAAIRDGFYNGCISAEPFNTGKDLFAQTFYDNPLRRDLSTKPDQTYQDVFPNFYNTSWSQYLFTKEATYLAPFANTQIYNPEQPCVESRYPLYQGKQARFYPDQQMSILTHADICEDLASTYENFSLPFCQDKVDELMNKGEDMAKAKLGDNCRQCEDAVTLTGVLNQLLKDPNGYGYTIAAPGSCLSSGPYNQFRNGLTKLLYNNGLGSITPQPIEIYSLLASGKWQISIKHSGNTAMDLFISLPGVSSLSEIQSVCCLRAGGALSENPAYEHNIELTIQKHLKPGDAGYNGLFANLPLGGSVPPNYQQLNVSGTVTFGSSLINCPKNVFFRAMPVTTSIQSFLNALTYNKPLVNLSGNPLALNGFNNYDLTWETQLYNEDLTAPALTLHHLELSHCDVNDYNPNFMAAFYTADLAAYTLMNCSETSDKTDQIYLSVQVLDNGPSTTPVGLKFMFHDMDIKLGVGFLSPVLEQTFRKFLNQSRSFELHYPTGVSLTFNEFKDMIRFDNVRVENGIVKIDGFKPAGTRITFTLTSTTQTLFEKATDLMDDVAYGENRVVEDVPYRPVPFTKCATFNDPDEFIEPTTPGSCDVPAEPIAQSLLHFMEAVEKHLPEGITRYTHIITCVDEQGCPNPNIQYVSQIPISSIRLQDIQGVGRVYGSKKMMKIYIGTTKANSKPIVDVIWECPFPARCLTQEKPIVEAVKCYDLCPATAVDGTDFGLQYNSVAKNEEDDCVPLSGSDICRWQNAPDVTESPFLTLYDPLSRGFHTSLQPGYSARFYSNIPAKGSITNVLDDAWSGVNNAYCMLRNTPENTDCHAKEYTMYMKVPANEFGAHEYRLLWQRSTISVEKNKEYLLRFELYRLQPSVFNMTVIVTINGATLTSFRYNDLYEFPWNSKNNEAAEIKIYVFNTNISGFEYLGLNNIRFSKSCRPTLCCPVIMPEVMVQSNCRDMLTNIAKSNAHIRYENYINKSRDEFKKRYIENCLGNLNEKFTMKYEDDEHHFTLYYYDQAGNLVRTVPPAGVNPIYDQQKLDRIKAERASGKRSEFTFHKMATTYRYNSLNQLVYQSTPDHDDIEDFRSIEQTEAFDTDAKVNDFTFPGNGNTGFAAGEDRTGTIKGHLFKTTDRGAKWTELSTFTLNDLNDLYTGTYSYSTPPANIFLGVGNKAMLVTKDGTQYVVSSLPLNGVNLIKIVSNDDTENKVLTLYAVADDGSFFTKSYSRDDDGEMVEGNWQGPGNGLKLKLSGKLKDIKHYGSLGMYATCDKGYIYYSSNQGSTWTIINRKNTRIGVELRKSVVSGSGTLMIFGDKGMLVNAVTDPANPDASWKKLNTGFTADIKDAAFATAQKGVLLIGNSLSSTSDGGTTVTACTLPSPYHTMNIAAVKYLLNKYYCITQGGHILESVNGSTWTAITADALSINATTGNVSSFYVTQAIIETNRICYVAGTVNGYCVYKGAGITGGSFSPYSSSSIVKVYVAYKSSQYHVIAQNADMKVIRANSSSPTLSWTNAGSFTGALFVRPDNETFIASGTLFKTTTDFTTLTPTWNNVPTPTVSLPASVNYLDIYQGNKLLVTGTGGSMIVVNPSDGIATNYSSNLTFDASLNSIVLFDYSDNKLGVVGQGGLYLVSDYTLGGTPKWVIRSSGTSNNLNAAAPFIASSHLEVKAVGDRGTVCWLNATSGVVLGDFGAYSSLNFTKLLSRPYQTFILSNSRRIVEQSGTILTNLDVTPASAQPKALVFDTDNNPLVGGTGGLIWKVQYSSLVKQNSALPPAFKTIAMSNNNNGIAAGVAGNVWRTTNGGSSWKQVSLSGYNTTNFVKVVFQNPTTGILIGNTGTGNTVALRTTDGGANWSTMSYLPSEAGTFNNISVKGEVYVIVGDANLVKVSKNGGLNWSTVSFPGGSSSISIKAVHISTDVSAFIGGETGHIYHIDLTSSSFSAVKKQPLSGTGPAFWTQTINSVYFADDQTGYLVANGNQVWKTVNAGTAWSRLAVSGTGTGPDFKGIAAANREDIVVMGDDGNTREFRLYDMTKEFSTRFYYDKLGRLALSQNSKQYGLPNDALRRYSYTLYDFKGRITEVGEAEVSQTNAAEKLYINGKLDDALLAAWINAAAKKQVTKTFYDTLPVAGNPNLPLSFLQKNLRNRVTASTYQETYNASVNTYDYAVHYNYDIHGNVSEMLTENRAISIKKGPYANYDGLMFKHTSYNYDLLSGKVNQVNYQQGKPDQFFHRYAYDKQNKLTEVYTSADGFNWEQDASYEYYLHGPLARTELGEEHVQGIDYTYTLQGWLKAVNGPRLDPAFDLGEDSKAGGDNTSFARDEAGFSLGYYTNDFAAVNVTAANSPVVTTANSDIQPSTGAYDLFNGNIGNMITNVRKLDAAGPLASRYKYDQLNRISTATYYNNFNTVTNAWNNGGTALPDHYNAFTYDANGNIKTQVRNGFSGINEIMDDLTYVYEADRNRLKGVNDNTPHTFHDGDLDNQGVSNDANGYRNYDYDHIGNLVKDRAEEIENIEWNTYGKIKRITRTVGSQKPDLEFTYGADGNRISKKVIPKTGYPDITFYSRDAQGNVMGTYTKTYQPDIYVDGLAYNTVNNQLLAMIGASQFEAFIPYYYQQGGPYLNGAVDYWYSHNGSLFDCSTINPAVAIANSNNIHSYLGGLKPEDVVDAFTAANGFTRNFFEKLCECGDRDEITQLLLYNESAFNALMIEMELLYPDFYFYFIPGVTWYDYQNDPSQVRYVMNEVLDCHQFGELMANYRANNTYEYGQFWLNQYEPMLDKLQKKNLEGLCLDASVALLNAMYAYDPNLIYNTLSPALGGDNYYLDMLVTWDPVTVLLGIFALDQSLDPNDTYNVSLILQNTGMGMSQYMSIIQSYLTPQQYALLLQQLQPSSPAVVEQTHVKERYLYGSSRLGSYTEPQLLASTKFTANYANGSFANVNFVQTPVVSALPAAVAGLTAQQVMRGHKSFELSNHLGNVLAVVSDRKTQTEETVFTDNYNSGIGNWTADLGTVSAVSGTVRITGDITSGGELPLTGLETGALYMALFDIKNLAVTQGNAITRAGFGTTHYLGNGKHYMVFKASASSVQLFISSESAPGVISSAPFTLDLDNFTLKKITQYNAEVLQANDYSPFGAPMQGRSYAKGQHDKVIANQKLYQWSFTSNPGTEQLNGWEPRFWTGSVPSAINTSVTLTEDLTTGKLKFTGEKRYCQAIYQFATVPGRVYKVKFKLSNSTIPLINISIFAPVARVNLVTIDYIATVGDDREVSFTATENVSAFYLTKSWSVANPTPQQSVYIDYLNITEEPTQLSYINCFEINDAIARMPSLGRNPANTTQVRDFLNANFTRNYSYEWYQSVLSHCTSNPTTFVLPQRGTDKSESYAYRFGFNGKEDDDETQTQDYGMRIYDPRLGRFLSVDPLTMSFPHYTPYQFAGNKPIIAVDLDGEEEKIVIHHLDIHQDGTVFVKQTETTIDQQKQFTGPSGTVYATTHVYYEYQGEIHYEGVILEEIKKDGMQPSAKYDYTKNVVEGKASEDIEYAKLNPEKWGEILQRDINAPDNARTVQDLKEIADVLINRKATKDEETNKNSIRKGERNQTSRPDGTDNPFKKMKPDPKNDKRVIMKDANGKEKSVAKPEGFDEHWEAKNKKR